MVLLELARQVINSPDEFKFEDFLEALQFINDVGRTDILTESQKSRLHYLVECGLVFTPPTHFLTK